MEKEFYIYEYHHVDDNRMMISLDEYRDKYINPKELDDFNKEVEEVKKRFKKARWEGDGDIEMVWIPPFCTSYYCTFGFFVFHVKQSNNGTSYIQSPYELESIKKFQVYI